MLENSNSRRRLDRLDWLIFGMLVVSLGSSAFSIALTEIGYFSALILWLLKMVLMNRWLAKSNPLDYFFLAYAIAEALATLFAEHKLYSLLYLQRRLLLIPLVYLLSSFLTGEKRVKILVSAIVISAVATALFGFQDLIFHLGEYLHFQRRLSEFQVYMTAGGIMMVVVLLLVAFLAHPRTPARIRWTIVAALIPLLINLFFTFTRSSWLGFLAGALVIGSIRTKKIFLPIIAGVLVILVLASPEIKGRIYSIVDPAHPNNVSRVNMWRTGVRIFEAYPIFGIGDVGVETVWHQFSDPGWGEEGHLHSNIMMWLVTVGIVGTTALVALFVKLWLVVATIERRSRAEWFRSSLALGGLAVMTGFHINGLFDWNFGDAEIITLVWAVVGLILASDRVGPSEIAC